MRCILYVWKNLVLKKEIHIDISNTENETNMELNSYLCRCTGKIRLCKPNRVFSKKKVMQVRIKACSQERWRHHGLRGFKGGPEYETLYQLLWALTLPHASSRSTGRAFPASLSLNLAKKNGIRTGRSCTCQVRHHTTKFLSYKWSDHHKLKLRFFPDKKFIIL